MQSKEYNLKQVAPASSRRISVSPFQRFGVCALIAVLWINTGYAPPAAAQDLDAESVLIHEVALADALQLDWFDLQPLDLPQDRPARFEAKVTFVGEEFTLSLERFSVRKDGFRLLVQDETGQIKEVEAPPPHTYRGTVLEIDGSEVAASLVDGQLSALIFLPDGSLWGIQPVSEVTPGAPLSWHVVYDSADIQPDPSFTCGTDDHMEVTGAPGEEGEDESRSEEGEGGPWAQGGEKVADIAFDTDVEFYQANGSSRRLTLFDIERIVNAMNVIFRRDVGIDHWITVVLVRTAEPDPYSAASLGGLLCQFRAEWNDNQQEMLRDTAHLMTGRDLTGGLGIAWTGVICNRVGRGQGCNVNANLAYALSEAWFSNFTRRVALAAQEIGHNWNAVHCDGDRDCFIMCSILGGCSGNLTKFGSRARSDIVAYRNDRQCLNTCLGVVNVPSNGSVFWSIKLACWGGRVAISAGEYYENFRINKKVKLTSQGGIVRIGFER